MRINNMLPVTLFAASLFFTSALFAQTNTFKKRPNFTAHLSTGHVQFGTGDIKGYGFLLAIVATVIPGFLISNAMKRIGSNNVAIVSSIGPVSTIIQAHFILGEQVFPAQIIGTIMVVGGVIMAGRKST